MKSVVIPQFRTVPSAAQAFAKVPKPMPQVLKDQLSDIRTWALDNRNDAQKDMRRYWSFKAPAILTAASTVIFTFLKWDMAVAIVGAISTAAITIDGFVPSGQLFNAHQRAFSDLSDLHNEIIDKWQIVSLDDKGQKETNKMVAEIIEYSQTEKKRISNNLKTAEEWLLNKKI